MIPVRGTLTIVFFSALFGALSWGQTPRQGVAGSESSELLNLARKIDQQNIKIDLLSQQILRLQQEVEHSKTNGVETAPRATQVASPVPATGGDTHVVAKGETLTSIARQHKVTVQELQKFNHIENDRTLQIGQTLVIPSASNTAASPSPSVSPPNE